MVNISGRGGISQNAYRLATALSRHDLGLVYLVPCLYEFNSHPHPFHVEATFRPLHDKGNIWRKLFTHIINVVHLQRQLSAYRPDICHLHEVKVPWLELRFVRWCHRKGVKVVYTAHDILHPERLNIGSALASFYAEVDGIIANAEENKQRITSTFNIDPQKIRVIVPGSLISADRPRLTDESKKHEIRLKLDLDEHRPTVLFFGYIRKIRKYKGLDILLKATNQLQRRKRRITLIIVGEVVGDFDSYQRLIDQCLYPGDVQLFLRYVTEKEMSEFFLASDLVVLPYRSIYQSGIVPVAYAHARPVIASRVGGLTEIIEDGRSGRLVPPNDPDALAEAMAELLNDPAAMKRMGEFAYKLVKDKYSWSSIAEETLVLYKKVLARSGQNRTLSAN